MYKLLVAAVTKTTHRAADNRNLFSPSSRGSKSTVKVLAGPAEIQTVGASSPLPCQVGASHPWHSWPAATYFESLLCGFFLCI